MNDGASFFFLNATSTQAKFSSWESLNQVEIELNIIICCLMRCQGIQTKAFAAKNQKWEAEH